MLQDIYFIIARAQLYLTGLPLDDDVMDDHISLVRAGLQEAKDKLYPHVI